MDARPYDLVLFGATGFTGQLVAEELVRRAPPLRMAVAGRDPDRLRDLVASLVGIDPAHGGLATITADVSDAASLRAMAESTRVLATTVGPYLRHGWPVLEACVAAGTHYLDLTGEPAFVRASRAAFDAPAREKRIKVVHCCGFDSVPADLGTLYTVARLPAGATKQVRAYVRTNAQMSGGTWASVLEILRTGVDGPFDRPWLHRVPDTSRRRAVPLPVVDRHVVRESARCRPDLYGPDFDYRQYLVVRDVRRAARLAASVGAGWLLVRFGPTRRWLERRIPSHQGPDEHRRARSGFEITFHGRADGARVTTRVSGGDPGYTETSRILAEASLLLAHGEGLPATSGVLSPAVAFGEVLIERLERIGLTFEVVDPPIPPS